MKQTNLRVRGTQETCALTDYVKLSRALQKDMLAAAEFIRHALYDNPDSEHLKQALIALDYPHFIPIENTAKALQGEFERLNSVFWDIALEDYFNPQRERVNHQAIDLFHELVRRDAVVGIGNTQQNPVETETLCKVCDLFPAVDGTGYCEIHLDNILECPYPDHCPAAGCAGECSGGAE